MATRRSVPVIGEAPPRSWGTYSRDRPMFGIETFHLLLDGGRPFAQRGAGMHVVH
jgi:hypothetical protein